jgi:hypothetical protein
MEVPFMSEFLNKFAQLDPLAPEVIKLFLYLSAMYFSISVWAVISEKQYFREMITAFLLVYGFLVAPICILNFILWIILGGTKYLVFMTIFFGILSFWIFWKDS